MRGTFKPKSFHLQWHITERCNLKCKHCYFNPKFLKNELTLEQLFSVLDQYLEMVGKWGLSKERTRVSITGGEPLERKDLFEFLERLYENRERTRYALMSNATKMDGKTARKIKELGVYNVQVSLEGLEKANDAIRGKGSFEKAVRGIRALRNEGMDVSISMTTTKANLLEVPRMAEFCESEGISFMGIRRFVPIGRGRKMKELMLSPSEVKKLYYYVFSKNFELKERGSGFSMGLGCEDGLLAQNFHYNPEGCSAAYLSFSVMPNADVYPCRRLPVKAGNALEESLLEIYYNSKKLRELRNLNNAGKECRECPYWIECRGGAKCISAGYYGNAFAPDPQCWRLFEKLPGKKFKKNIRQEEKLNEYFIEES